MARSATLLPTLLSIVAVGVAVGTLATREAPEGGDATSEVSLLESRIASLEDEIERLRAERPAALLRGTVDPTAAIGEATRQAAGGVIPKEGSTPGKAADPEALAALVDQAVDRKAAEVRREMAIKADKKPAIDLLAKTLELDARQKAAIEREVIRGQDEIFAVLETPTEDGTNLLEELAEGLARQAAEPGKPSGLGTWFQRVIGEKVPGTNRTYAAAIEAVKQTMRTSFERTMSDEQFEEYKAWGVDPAEIRDVEGARGGRFEERVKARARELGAVLPEDD